MIKTEHAITVHEIDKDRNNIITNVQITRNETTIRNIRGEGSCSQRIFTKRRFLCIKCSCFFFLLSLEVFSISVRGFSEQGGVCPLFSSHNLTIHSSIQIIYVILIGLHNHPMRNARCTNCLFMFFLFVWCIFIAFIFIFFSL